MSNFSETLKVISLIFKWHFYQLKFTLLDSFDD